MADVDFGLDIDDDALILKVLQESKRTDPMTAKSILQQAYETTHGIYDYLMEAVRESSEPDPHKKRPLSSVALHFAEDYSRTSRLYEMLDIFIDKNVYGTTGLNLHQFLELPHDIAQQVLMKCDKKQAKDAQAQSEVLNNLNNTRNR